MLGPVLGHPAGNRPLVALDGAAGGTQQAVVQPVAQQLPHVAGMVADPGELLDHAGHARQGPVIGVEAVRAGALAERLVNGAKLLVRQARGAYPVGPALRNASNPPWRHWACQRLTFCRATPRERATSAWQWPAANSVPACMRTPSNAWRSHSPRALRR
jgi:hypothetical protein